MSRNRLPILMMLLVPLWLCGCAAYQPLQIEPVRKTTPISPKFTQSYYYYDQDQNLYFVMRAHTPDPRGGGGDIEQIATVRVFWRPRGGVTTMQNSALDATFRYIIMTPDAVGMYEGAGFVRLLSKTGAAKFNARIMDGDLRLTQASARFEDRLGRARIDGSFSAVYDDAKAVDTYLNAHREFFARSLASKPVGQPAAPDFPGIPAPPATSPAPSAMRP